MQHLFRGVVFAACLASAASATAGELTLKIANGRVTLIAQDVPVRQILTEWAKVGGTKIVNADKLVGPTVTLHLVDRPEREVLDVLLRHAAGYVAAPRDQMVANLSVYDRVVILATSNAPAYTPSAVTTPAFTRPPVIDDDPVTMPPGAMPQPGMPMPPGAVTGPQALPVPGMPNAPGTPTNQPMTAPRPGMLPPPPTGTPNPFVPGQPPVVRPPGGPGGGGQVR